MAIKRRAAPAAAALAPAKKQATAKVHVSKQCGVIATAVKAATGYPQTVLNIVGGNLPDCLGVPKEERHPYHEKLIGMVGEVLNSVESGIQNKVNAAEDRLNSANTEKAARDAALEAAKGDVVAKNEALAVAKAQFQERSATAKTAKASLSEAESEHAEGNAKSEAATQKKARLEFAMSDGFTPLEEGTATGPAAKTKVATVLKVAKECELDPSLLTSLAATLAKAPDARGTFDKLVCDQVKEGLQNSIQAVNATLEAGEADKAARAAKVDAAKGALEAAQGQETASKEALEECKVEAETSKGKEKDSAKLVSQFGGEINQTRKDLTAARAELETLQGGALAAYKELLEYTNVVPEAPAALDEAAATSSTA